LQSTQELTDVNGEFIHMVTPPRLVGISERLRPGK